MNLQLLQLMEGSRERELLQFLELEVREKAGVYIRRGGALPLFPRQPPLNHHTTTTLLLTALYYLLNMATARRIHPSIPPKWSFEPLRPLRGEMWRLAVWTKVSFFHSLPRFAVTERDRLAGRLRPARIRVYDAGRPPRPVRARVPRWPLQSHARLGGRQRR